jgi:glycolate oxidase
MTLTIAEGPAAELRAGLPAHAVLTDADSRTGQARDAAPFSEAGDPAVVVVPENVEQVRHVLRVAHAAGIPVVPQGARTGLAGAANAGHGGAAMIKTSRFK